MNSWLRNNRLIRTKHLLHLNVLHSILSTTRRFETSNAKFVFVQSKHYNRISNKGTLCFSARGFLFI